MLTVQCIESLYIYTHAAPSSVPGRGRITERITHQACQYTAAGIQ